VAALNTWHSHATSVLTTAAVGLLDVQGVEDMKRGVISTPLSPVTTLLDDPLRALRAIRFAARLRFKIDPELEAGLRSPDVHVRSQPRPWKTNWCGHVRRSPAGGTS